MRVESVDEVEIIRRMTEEIYDKEEYEKALAWTKANCKEGFDKNPDWIQKSREEKDAQWEFVVKMMVIIKDLMAATRTCRRSSPRRPLDTMPSQPASRDRDSGQTSIQRRLCRGTDEQLL